jgi:hypothetical protein
MALTLLLHVMGRTESREKSPMTIKCDYCREDVETTFLPPPALSGKWCSERHMVDHLNTIRLAYYPWQLYQRDVIDLELTLGTGALRTNALAANGRLIAKMTSEELVHHIWLLKTAVVDMTLLVHKLASQESSYEREKTRAKLAGEVALRDSKKIGAVAADRETAEKKKAIKALGEKISPDGKCVMCGAASTALTCTTKCKENWQLSGGWRKMGFPQEKIEEMLKAMGKL